MKVETTTRQIVFKTFVGLAVSLQLARQLGLIRDNVTGLNKCYSWMKVTLL